MAGSTISVQVRRANSAAHYPQIIEFSAVPRIGDTLAGPLYSLFRGDNPPGPGTACRVLDVVWVSGTRVILTVNAVT